MKRWTLLCSSHVRFWACHYQCRGFSTQAALSEAASESGNVLEINQARKTISTAVGPLPISPLMDESYLKAKLRWTRPKAKPQGQKGTKFQRKLQRNPFAQALISPYRLCPVTSVHLPRFFLQSFSPMSHPETGDPWWVPYDMSTMQAGRTAGRRSNRGQPRGGTGYILARQDLLQALTDRKSKYKGAQRKLLRMSNPTEGLTAVMSQAVWREDMDAMVLELMRRRIVEDLLYFSKMCGEQGRKYLTRLGSLDEIKALKHRGCVLYLEDAGPLSPTGTKPMFDGPLTTFDVEGARYDGKLLIHNLVRILGKEHAAQLRRESRIFQDGSLFLLGRQPTVWLQMRLWKLQGYLTNKLRELHSSHKVP